MADSSVVAAPSTVPGGAPDKPRKSKDGFQGGGRKIVANGKENKQQGQGQAGGGGKLNQQGGDAAKKAGGHQNASLEELDKLLEEDALELMNMKRNMAGAQAIELNKARKMLANMKKEFNEMKIKNDEKEILVVKTNDKIIELQAIQASKEKTGLKVEDVYGSLKKETEDVSAQIECETRLKNMQDHINVRLDQEIEVCKKETALESVKLEDAMHEFETLNKTLEVSTRDLTILEKKMDKMITTIKFRKQEREEKMGMLNNIVMEGQDQMEKIQAATLSESESLSLSIANKKANSGTPSKGSPAKSNNANNQNEDTGAILAVSKLTDPVYLRSLTPDQVKELSERYINKDARLQKLEAMDEELRRHIADQKEKKLNLEDKLSRTAIKYQQMASTRQIYQEVDMKDAALNAARKESEVCKEREHQLNIHIESLKKAIPRFLTKLTKMYHPIPSTDQVADAVRKLEDEVTKSIKIIQASLLKEATPEDLALASSLPTSARDTTASELMRLHKVPGYGKLKTLLFYNLMSSQADNSQYNIRIEPKDKKINNELSDPDPRDNKGGDNKKGKNGGNNHRSSSTSFGTDKEDDLMAAMLSNNPGDGGQQGYQHATLDRDTIKNIAKLFVDKDQMKMNKLAAKGKTVTIDPRASPTRK